MISDELDDPSITITNVDTSSQDLQIWEIFDLVIETNMDLEYFFNKFLFGFLKTDYKN